MNICIRLVQFVIAFVEIFTAALLHSFHSLALHYSDASTLSLSPQKPKSCLARLVLDECTLNLPQE